MADEREVVVIEIDRLFEFVDDLQANGYRIDPRQIAALNHLLLTLIARGEALDQLPLKMMIAPLVCSTALEQEDFYQRFEHWQATLLPVKQIDSKGELLPPSQEVDIPPAIAPASPQKTPYITREATKQETNYTKVLVKGYVQEILPVTQIKPIVSALRKRTQIPSTEVDVERTIEYAINHNNWMEVVYRQRQALPEYVVLIDRKNRLDLQARFVQEVLEKLAADGVWLHQYEFKGDPRICFPLGKKNTPLRLKDLQARHPDSRLLVFSGMNELINPLTGNLQEWVESLEYWKERAILTPDKLGKVLLEELESQDFAILPLTFDGLASIVRVFETDNLPLSFSDSNLPAPLTERPTRWTGRNAPPEPEVKALINELKINYLGENGFYWLCATAVYPELRWELTLHLGSVLIDNTGKPLLDAKTLILIARLPWFRIGYMPDWIRLHLIERFLPEQEAKVREVLSNLISSTQDGLAFELTIAREKAESLPKQILQDHVMLKFLVEIYKNRLAVEVPSLSNLQDEAEVERETPLELLSEKEIADKFQEMMDDDRLFEYMAECKEAADLIRIASEKYPGKFDYFIYVLYEASQGIPTSKAGLVYDAARAVLGNNPSVPQRYPGQEKPAIDDANWGTQLIQSWYDRAVTASRGTLEECLSALQIFRYLGGLSKEKPYTDMPDYILTLRTDNARQAAAELVDDLRTKCLAPIDKAFNAGANLSEEDISYLANLARILREGNLIYSDAERKLAAWAEVKWAKVRYSAYNYMNASSSELDAMVEVWADLNIYYPDNNEITDNLNVARNLILEDYKLNYLPEIEAERKASEENEKRGSKKLNTKRKLSVYLCHAVQDNPDVRDLYARLNSELWINLWLDEENLLPGQNWDLEIQKTLRNVDTIIICLSKVSVAKEGYLAKEIKRALDIADEKPEGTVHIIPLRLDDCEIPFRLKKFHWVDYFSKNYDQILFDTLKARAEGLGIQTEKTENKAQEKPNVRIERLLRVFIAHTAENKSDAKYLYDYLHKLDMAPWLDSEKIKGQNWNKAILKALDETDVLLLCLSKKSVNKRGDLTPTLKSTLDHALKEPEESIVIIPVRLDNCEIPRVLQNYQSADLFAENGIERLLESLSVRAQQVMAKSILLEELPAFELRKRKYNLHEQIEDSLSNQNLSDDVGTQKTPNRSILEEKALSLHIAEIKNAPIDTVMVLYHGTLVEIENYLDTVDLRKLTEGVITTLSADILKIIEGLRNIRSQKSHPSSKSADEILNDLRITSDSLQLVGYMFHKGSISEEKIPTFISELQGARQSIEAALRHFDLRNNFQEDQQIIEQIEPTLKEVERLLLDKQYMDAEIKLSTISQQKLSKNLLGRINDLQNQAHQGIKVALRNYILNARQRISDIRNSKDAEDIFIWLNQIRLNLRPDLWLENDLALAEFDDLLQQVAQIRDYLRLYREAEDRDETSKALDLLDKAIQIIDNTGVQVSSKNKKVEVDRIAQSEDLKRESGEKSEREATEKETREKTPTQQNLYESSKGRGDSILNKTARILEIGNISKASPDVQISLCHAALMEIEKYLDTADLRTLNQSSLANIRDDILEIIKIFREIRSNGTTPSVKTFDGILDKLRLTSNNLQVALGMYNVSGLLSEGKSRKFFANIRDARKNIEDSLRFFNLPTNTQTENSSQDGTVSSIGKLDSVASRQFVNILLDCHSLDDDATRRSVINWMGKEVANNVSFSGPKEIFIEDLINTCLDYDRGLEMLVNALESYEGDTEQVRKLKLLLDLPPLPKVVGENSYLKTNYAQCCKPRLGDEIIGVYRSGRGVEIHRTDCANLQNLNLVDSKDLKQVSLVQVSWEADEFIDKMRSDVLTEKVHVTSFQGDVVDLPAGSTPIDFAYHIHTNIGHKCIGAKVNGKIVPLYYELKNGDKVEILTSKKENPSLDWLNPNLGLVRTDHARSRIRQWFKNKETK